MNKINDDANKCLNDGVHQLLKNEYMQLIYIRMDKGNYLLWKHFCIIEVIWVSMGPLTLWNPG